MYVLIGGAGLVGLGLAQRLVNLGHTVAMIDIDPVACRYAREQIGVMAFEGSAVSTEVLLDAGIRKVDALAAVLRDDALNRLLEPLTLLMRSIWQFQLWQILSNILRWNQ